MNQKKLNEASQRIADSIQKAREEIEKAKKIADEFGLTFFWEPPAPALGEGTGMGGTYFGKNSPERETYEKDEYTKYNMSDGWLASSGSC